MTNALQPASAFPNWKPINVFGLDVERREELTIASFAAAKGKASLLKAAVHGAYGAALPTSPQRVTLGKGVDALWAGPDQWLAIADRQRGRDLENELRPILNGFGSVTDQSDARAVVRVSGPRARDLLAKGVPIDLDPRAFPANGVAITHAAHIGVILWQLGATQTYELAMFRSFADSFERWLHQSTEEWAIATPDAA